MPYLGIFSPLEDEYHFHVIEYRHHSQGALLSIHQKQGTIVAVTGHLPVGSPYPKTPGKFNQSRHGQPALEGSSNPSYDGVIKPMFSKFSTHGVIEDVIERPLYVKKNTCSCLP